MKHTASNNRITTSVSGQNIPYGIAVDPNGYIYCVGTDSQSPYNYVYYAPISSTGIGAWTSSTTYPIQMYYAYCEIPGSGGCFLGGGGPN